MGRIPPTAILFISSFLSCFIGIGSAQPATLQFQDCFTGNDTLKINVSTVYGQILTPSSQTQKFLNLTVFGESGQDITGFSNESLSLATLFTTTSILTLNTFTNSSYFCTPLRPPSPLPAEENPSEAFCPVPAGPLAFSSSIPWGKNRDLTTMNTRLRAVDPFSNELLCVDVSTTPLQPGHLGSPYGNAVIIFWTSITLVIVYWLVVGIARIVSAWSRGISRPGAGLGARVESFGFILASAISGERLATSPALMRFCTPSMRDIVFHTQWCSVLAMVAVQWPTFVYPLLAQTAWSTLSYNITLSDANGATFHHWDPLSTQSFNPPSNFADQLSDPNSPLYINGSVPNTLFTLPADASSGISSFAYTIGIRPQDLFGVCLALFLSIIAGTIFISLVIWSLDWLVWSLGRALGTDAQHSKLPGSRSPRMWSASRDVVDSSGMNANLDEIKSANGHSMSRVTSRINQSATFWKTWWRRTNINSFHGSVLHGNLVRILILFHLPVTIFSCYQMTLPRSHASLPSIVLAALSFVVFSLLLPIFLVFRVTVTTTNKLYDETRTLLSLGPLYCHYRHGSQLFASLLFATNFAYGVTIGCGQKSGTAQAIIILVIEVISALVTSVWLPWGSGASMGLISFLFCVARIVVAVLLVILTPTISIGQGAGGWVAYGILIILVLVYFAFSLILVVKLIEAAVRIVGGVGFDRSHHLVDSGLLGTCGLCGCCGPRPRHRSRRRRYRAREVPNPDVSFTPQAMSGVVKNSSAPPSVLRPEHALRPYREDSDDENGHIMGDWQPFPRPVNQPFRESLSPTQSPSPQNSSGFSRVGGGRAHYDSPYAIASGSSQAFPSMEPNIYTSPLAAFSEDESSSPSISRNQVSSLPPGAMNPVHVRTKSQTAIVENSSILRGGSVSRTGGNFSPPPVIIDGPDSDSDAGHAKKEHWYQRLRPRPRSEGSAPPAHDEGFLSPSSPTQPGRSFVVIRGHKPQTPPSRTSHSSIPNTPTQRPDTPTSPGSFTVLRGKGTESARGFLAST